VSTQLAPSPTAGTRDALFRAHLPMVYNLVRQALGGAPDVDDVVQDVVLDALRQLHHLHDPESFRSRLAAIAVRHVRAYLDRADNAAAHLAPLDAAAWQSGGDIEGPALLRVELAAQRRQVRSAGRWLSAEDRAVLSLWWLETAGELSRRDVATALGVSVPHAGVRLQRMREQLDLSRAIVAALEAVPGCADLGNVIATWNGVPNPFWRKRIARHLKGCRVCSGTGADMIPAERLLAGLGAVPLPAALTDLAGRAPAVGSGFLGALRPLPWVAGVGGAAVVAALTVVIGGGSSPAPPVAAPPAGMPPAAAAPQPPAVPRGRVSLESANVDGGFVAISRDVAILDTDARRPATFQVVAGLADPDCYSFRTADGRLLRHAQWRLRAAREEPTPLFRGDATFCVRAGAAPGTVALESANYPGRFLRHTGTELWVNRDDDSAKFRSDSAFRIAPA
jgi:RNA polymerase sigma factor (sigma-70 family)